MISFPLRLGDDKFRYSHFNFNKDGDMIIDTEAYPFSQERRFYGLKNNGRFFFNDSNNNSIPYFSMNSSYSDGRIEGESHFIKLINGFCKKN